MRLQVWSLALLSGLTTWGCRELWCRSKTRLRYGVAVALVKASGCSSHLTPILGSFICCKCSSKGKKKSNIQVQAPLVLLCFADIILFTNWRIVAALPQMSKSTDTIFFQKHWLCISVPILEILMILFVMVMCDQWLRQKDYDSLKAPMIAGVFFSNTVPFN